MRFSLILATVGRKQEVAEALESISRQTYRDFHVIIVDQNSDERLADVIGRYRGEFEIEHLRAEPGLSRARNLGLLYAKGDVVAFPDDDCVYPDWLLSSVAGAFSEPTISGVTGRTCLDEELPSQFSDDKRITLNRYNVWKYAISYTIFLRRDVVRAVGDFDVDLGVGAGTPWGAGEETDYLLRALSLGVSLEHLSGLAVAHPNKDIADIEGIQRARKYSQGIGRVLAKQGRFSLPTLFSIFKSLAALAVAASSGRLLNIKLATAKLSGKIFGWRSKLDGASKGGKSVWSLESVASNDARVDICMFIPNLNGGGAERVMLVIAREFVEMGYRVDFVVTKHWGKLKEQVPDGARYISLSQGRVLYSIPAYLRYLRVARPTTVISSLENANIVSCAAKVLSSHKHHLTIRIENSFVESGPLWKQKSRWFWLILIAATFRFADSFICISQGIQHQLKHVPGCARKPAFQISNPVITRDFEEKRAEPSPFGGVELAHRPRLVAVGRLHRQKDYPTLLRAFALTLTSINCELHILGEGDDLEALSKLAEDLGITSNVTFHGFVPNPIRYMANADLFVLSSAWEGFGNVVVEALAAGVPVVSTDCPHGPAEILRYGEFGKLVPVGDVEQLSAAMVDSLRNLDARAQTDSALVAHLQDYDCRFIAKAYADVLQL